MSSPAAACPPRKGAALKRLSITVALLALLPVVVLWPVKAGASTVPSTSTVQAFAKQLAAQKGWTGSQWVALETIIAGPVHSDGRRWGGESGWDPCAVNPMRHDCTYGGTHSCGIPQASPCPSAWRGRLAAVWRAQVRWLIAYVASRYGDPLTALAHHNTYGSY